MVLTTWPWAPLIVRMLSLALSPFLSLLESLSLSGSAILPPEAIYSTTILTSRLNNCSLPSVTHTGGCRTAAVSPPWPDKSGFAAGSETDCRSGFHRPKAPTEEQEPCMNFPMHESDHGCRGPDTL